MGAFQIGDARLYIVADGMGGHNAGALAAAMTVRKLHESLAERLPEMPVAQAIEAALQSANQWVYEAAHAGDPATHRMGSTVVLLLTVGRMAHVAHVGDSRAYLYRGGRLSRLTRDHSQVQSLLDTGVLTPAQARSHPLASVIERAIGNEPQVDATLREPLSLRPGDGILLCSDGLCGYVDDEKIEAVLNSPASVQELADDLVGLALDAGGQDNVTVQFIQYGDRREARAKRRMGRLFNDQIGKPRSVSLSFRTLSVLAAVCALAGGIALAPRLWQAGFGDRALGEASPKAGVSIAPERFAKTLDELEAKLRATQQRVESNSEQINSLLREMAALKRDVEKMKRKRIRHR